MNYYKVWFKVNKRTGEFLTHHAWFYGDYHRLMGGSDEVYRWDLKPCDIAVPDVVWVFVEGEFDE